MNYDFVCLRRLLPPRDFVLASARSCSPSVVVTEPHQREESG
nr:MAG TPA: hypothetical protein [Caudoviricetes sp.]